MGLFRGCQQIVCRLADSLQLSSEDSPSQYKGRHAQRRAADHECDDDNIPERPMIVKEWEIQGMKAGIQPPVHPIPAAVSGYDARRFGIDVIARLVGVVHKYEDNWKRPLARAVEVVQIVLIKDAGFDSSGIRNGGPDDVDDLFSLESVYGLAFHG